MDSSSPDSHGRGFLATDIDALRYDGHTDDPHEVAGILQSLMPGNARVLDIGCGTGSVTTIANHRKNNSVYGIEPDPARAQIARSRGIDVFEGYLTDEYFIGREKFDVIVFADVLEHVAEPSELLRLARRGLSQDGIVLVSVPNVAHWTVRVRLLLGRFEYANVGIMDATHLRWFTGKTISKLLNRSGFEVLVRRQTAGTVLPEYQNRTFRWIPYRFRRTVIRRLAVTAPSLFCCQYVLKARMKV